MMWGLHEGKLAGQSGRKKTFFQEANERGRRLEWSTRAGAPWALGSNEHETSDARQSERRDVDWKRRNRFRTSVSELLVGRISKLKLSEKLRKRRLRRREDQTGEAGLSLQDIYGGPKLGLGATDFPANGRRGWTQCPRRGGTGPHKELEARSIDRRRGTRGIDSRRKLTYQGRKRGYSSSVIHY